MPEQERKQKRTDAAPPSGGGQGSAAAATKGKKLKEDMDRLVDEIDDVLEENAEEFVKSYVQRGGE
jgi:ubiquitin-like protein Pup